METALEQFIAEHVRRVEPLLTAGEAAHWEASTSGTEEAGARAARLHAELMRVYADAAEFERLRGWERSPPDDPLVARQLRLLRLAYEQGQQDAETIDALANLEKELQAAFVNFRGVLRGQPLSDNELVAILHGETDEARLREAWEASKQVGRQVAERILQAVALRNAAARRLGYADHYHQSLALAEIDAGRLFELLGELERLTDEPFRQLKAELDQALARHYGVAPERLRPWHYGNPFFQEAPHVGSVSLDPLLRGHDLEALATRTFDGLGLEVRDVLARSDLYARQGKDQHAFCSHIDRRGDVRILCNLVPNERWMETLLHELGHAVYDKYLAPGLPFVLRTPAHTFCTEGVAMLVGRLPLSQEWLTGVLGVAESEAEALGAPARARQRLGMLIFVRWVLVMVHFERALYADPGRDLDTLWWDLVERYQLVRRPDGRRAPDWAAKTHLALYPAYYQNYMLGELLASQLQRWLRRECGWPVGRPEAGRLLRERLFERGATAHWDTTIEAATGERLDPGYFVAEFVAAS